MMEEITSLKNWLKAWRKPKLEPYVKPTLYPYIPSDSLTGQREIDYIDDIIP